MLWSSGRGIEQEIFNHDPYLPQQALLFSGDRRLVAA